MSRWNRYYPTNVKLPPPKRGIKAKVSREGGTWWGKRWIEALERMSSSYANRLPRGRSYARAGRTHDLEFKNGTVTARVTGSRLTPYKVSITLTPLSDQVWSEVLTAMATRAQFSVELLARQMPREIDAVFEQAGTSIFPVDGADMDTHCSCPDWANPCKHVAATHYVLGEALERDPFLLFELRGRTREQVLNGLRTYRSGKSGTKGRDAAPRKRSRKRTHGPKAGADTLSLSKLKKSSYDQRPGPLPVLQLRFHRPDASGVTLQQLGTPASWSGARSPYEMFGSAVQAAADRARSLALEEPE